MHVDALLICTMRLGYGRDGPSRRKYGQQYPCRKILWKKYSEGLSRRGRTPAPPYSSAPRTSKMGDTYWPRSACWPGAAAILSDTMDGDRCDSDLEAGEERGASSAASTVAAVAEADGAAAAASYPPISPLPLNSTMHCRRGQDALGWGGVCRRWRVCRREKGDAGYQRSEAGRWGGGEAVGWFGKGGVGRRGERRRRSPERCSTLSLLVQAHSRRIPYPPPAGLPDASFPRSATDPPAATTPPTHLATPCPAPPAAQCRRKIHTKSRPATPPNPPHRQALPLVPGGASSRRRGRARRVSQQHERTEYLVGG